MNIRRLAPTFTLALVVTTSSVASTAPSPALACPGSYGAGASTHATPAGPAGPARRVTACESLEPAAGSTSGALFGAPLAVVDTARVYRYEGRQLRRIPEGVLVRVRAEPGLTAPLIHRMVACRVGVGNDTRIAVRAHGPSFVIELRSREPEVARALQAEHAPAPARGMTRR